MTFSSPIPAVLLPGMDGTGDLLTSFAARLAAHRPVDIIAYPAGQPLGYAALQTYIESRLPAGRFVVIGESFSGPLAIAVAATNERTAGLILASRFANHPLPSFLVKLAPYAKLAWVPTALAVALLLGRHTTPDLKQRLVNVLAGLSEPVMRGRIAAVLSIDQREKLSQVTCPILCLHGRSDRLVRAKFPAAIAAAQPVCRVEWLDAPHMLLETQPDAAAATIEAFCQRLAA